MDAEWCVDKLLSSWIPVPEWYRAYDRETVGPGTGWNREDAVGTGG